MNKLELRIRKVALEMDRANEKKFCGVMPHSEFVRLDDLWSIAEDPDYELGLTEESTDEEIRKAILSREATTDDYYWENVVDYKVEKAIPVVADALATAMAEQFPIEGEKMSTEDVMRAREIAIELLSDDKKFKEATGYNLRKAFLFEVTDNDIKAIEPGWGHAFSNVWFRMRGKQVHKFLRTDVKKCLSITTLAWSC